MKNVTLTTSLILLAALSLSGCGQATNPSALEESCSGSCSEKTINAPVAGTPTPAPAPLPVPARTPKAAYRFPEFDPSWGMGRATYEKMVKYYNENLESIPNPRYAVIIDFSQPMGQRRFYLYDLQEGTVEAHVTAHGRNSDKDNDGFPTEFSNTPNSLQSSLGFYLTLATYNGSHGYSLRLRGLEETNSNAEARDIVVHPADYVSDDKNYAGRSWGCPALDPKISKSVIDRIRNGALIYADFDASRSKR